MSGWKVCRLEDIGRIVTGKTPPTKIEANFGTEYPFITPKDIQQSKHIWQTERFLSEQGLQYVKGCLLPEGAVCVSCIGNLGYVSMTTQTSVSNQQINSIIADEKIVDKDFVYYSMKHLNSYFKNLEGVSTVVSILNKTLFSQIKIDLPPLAEQRAIAATLSCLDDKIENNTKINNCLEQMAQAIFKSWFVDFEPFGGVMPKNWGEGMLGDYCSVKSGFAFKSSWWQDNGIRVIKIKNITNSGIDFTDCSYVSDDKASYAKDFIANAGDLLIAMTGATIGKFAFIARHNEKLLVNQRVGKFFLGANPLDKLPFLWCLLKQDEVFKEIINRGQGSAQPNISPTDIMTIPTLIPSKEILDDFNENLKSSFEIMTVNAAESYKLATLRDALLPRLMSGELSVADIGDAK
jgi:type I restriction enzyme S subunit